MKSRKNVRIAINMQVSDISKEKSKGSPLYSGNENPHLFIKSTTIKPIYL